MWDILVILGCLTSGMAGGYVFRQSALVLGFFSRLTMASIYILLFILGAGLGHDEHIYRQLPTLGVTSLVLALCCCLGSIAFVLIIQRYFPQGQSKPSQGGGQLGPLAATGKIFCCFIAGIAAARFDILPTWFYGARYAVYALWIMVFSVGISLGAELKAFAIVRERPGVLLAVPLLTIVGTVFGASLAGVFLPDVSVRETVTAGCGLGYYTFSSLLVGETGNAKLAAITLLANIFRELLAVMTTPFVVRIFGPLAPVAVGGATAMDTCLPVIARFSGERIAIAAVFSGMSLTLAVPFLMSFLLAW